jgi:hypothetical protein
VINLSVITSWAFNLADKDALSETTMRTGKTDIVTFGSRPMRSRRPDLTTFGGDVELGGGITVTTVLESDREFSNPDTKTVKFSTGDEIADMNESKNTYDRG